MENLCFLLQIQIKTSKTETFAHLPPKIITGNSKGSHIKLWEILLKVKIAKWLFKQRNGTVVSILERNLTVMCRTLKMKAETS